MHRAANYKRDCPENYIVKEIMGTSSFHGNVSTRYGNEHESVAKKLYIEKVKPFHTKFKVNKCGMLVSQENPLIRATPDGIVSCKCCGSGLLEIKCPFTSGYLTGIELAQIPGYHVTTTGEDGKVQLKLSSPWYTQIQTQLGVSGLPWCDFVMFTQKDITVERIFFDKSMFSENEKKAMKCYNRFVLPKLLATQCQL